MAARAQSDSTRLLPTAEVNAARMNHFSVGQIQIKTDSFAKQLFDNQRLTHFLTFETPLSIRAYGTGNAGISARGLSANHTAVVWNGINLQNPLNGGFDANLLDMSAVGQVRVALGGGSALSGSGAVGAAVFIDDDFSIKSGWHGSLGFWGGSFGFQNPAIGVSLGREKWGTSFHFAQQSALNDFTFRNIAEIGQPLQRAQNAAFDMINIKNTWILNFDSKNTIRINGWWSQNNRQLQPTMTSRNERARLGDTTLRLMAEWSYLSKKAASKTRFAYLLNHNFFESDVIKNSQNAAQTLVAESELTYVFSEKQTFRMGFNATIDSTDNSNYAQNRRRDRAALYLNHTYKNRYFKLSSNLRQEWISERGFVPTTFSLGLEKPIFQRWILRGSISRDFNVPSFNDLYWAGLGVPTLLPENGWTKELGISFSHKNTAASAHKAFELTADATVFDIKMNQNIVWRPQADGVWRPSNLNLLLSRGAEFLVRFTWISGNLSQKISLNYQFADARDGAGGVALFTPQHAASGSWRIMYKKLYGVWHQSWSSRRFSSVDRETWTNPFGLTQGTFGFKPTIGGVGLDVQLQVFNLFNTDYQVIPFFANPRRHFRAGLSLRI
ncbi:MAG: TonB-dependent receptor plug domain-containing protein [Saprospiraceae bacterium]|nr:TonB-dependent receptor plug domain-containing protein [Saprospiraceae bacterium]